MQPYFLPYIGYFQLMNAVNEFVVYDNIEFTKKGWINRNKILVNGKSSYITIPLKKDSDYLDVKDRYLSDNWYKGKNKMLNKIVENYRVAPYFNEVFPVIEKCISFEESNLFKFLLYSLYKIKNYINIPTSVITSSIIPVDPSLKAEKKVIDICKKRNAKQYLNPIGGKQLYNKNEFKNAGIELYFLQTNNINYNQINNEFVPWLSIIDVMMFNSKEKIDDILNLYELT